MADEPEESKVGYGRPPMQTRFSAGKSGNPKGRPKGSRNLTTEIHAELDARQPIKENGKRKSVTKRKVVAKQVVNKAVAGDPKAIGIILQQDRAAQDAKDLEAKRKEFSLAVDQRVMAGILERMRAMNSAVAIETPSSDLVSPHDERG